MGVVGAVVECGVWVWGIWGEIVTLYKLKAITTTADQNNLDLRDPLERYSIFLI